MDPSSFEFVREYGRDVYDGLFENFYQHRSGQNTVDGRFTFFNVQQIGLHSFTFEAVYEQDDGDTVTIFAQHADEHGSVVDSWSKTARATGKEG